MYTKMMDCLDYVFYRISKFYIKHGEDFDGWRGYIYTCAMLSNLVCFIIMILFGVVRLKLSSVTAITFFYLLVFSLNLLLFHKRYTKQSIFEQLSKQYNCEYDDRGTIGKRYRRQDEIGTPFCVTYDFDSETDGCVTVRDRDTMQQERIAIADLKAYFEKKMEF